MQHARPSWYTHDDDSAWDKVKEAFQRDWRQTKHDFGGNEPDLNQQVTDTVSQAAGREPIPKGSTPNPKKASSADTDDVYDANHEDAYRYGYAAYRHHGADRDWDAQMESRLRDDWGDEGEWQQHRAAVRRGWMFGKNESCCGGSCKS